MTKSIGLIGIGVMGSNIALNFSEKGTSVHVFNQSEDKINSLIEKDYRIFTKTEKNSYANSIW
jgi:6-phosphogluconate dehydrogenase